MNNYSYATKYFYLKKAVLNNRGISHSNITTYGKYILTESKMIDGRCPNVWVHSIIEDLKEENQQLKQRIDELEIRKQERLKVIEELEEWVDNNEIYEKHMRGSDVIVVDTNTVKRILLKQKLNEMKGEHK